MRKFDNKITEGNQRVLLLFTQNMSFDKSNYLQTESKSLHISSQILDGVQNENPLFIFAACLSRPFESQDIHLKEVFPPKYSIIEIILYKSAYTRTNCNTGIAL